MSFKNHNGRITPALYNLVYAVFICAKLLFKNFKFTNTFNFSNALKLAFIYASAIFWIVIVDFKFSDKFFKKLLSGELSTTRMSIYSVKDRMGEGALYYRVIKVAKDKGIDYSAIRFSEGLSHFWLTKHFYYVAASLINYAFKPHFNLAVTHHVNIIPHGYNVTYLNMPAISLYDDDGYFQSSWRHLTEYQAYADLHTFVHGDNKILDQALVLHKLVDKKIVPIYLAQNYVEYKEPHIEKAIIIGSLWGCNRNSLRVSRAFKKLAADNLLEAYGLKSLSFLKDAYKGPFEKFGSPMESILKIQNDYGIALIIHNMEHMLEAIPTSRVSEAAASGALMISDQHYFVKKYFGENALYFDAFGTDEEIYQQIKSHILWAQNNKPQAIEKSKKAYDVFAKNFTMEIQLESLMQQLDER